MAAKPLPDRIRFFQCAIDENETFAVLKRALPRNSASRSAAGAKLTLLARSRRSTENSARMARRNPRRQYSSQRVSCREGESCSRSHAAGKFICLIDLREPRDFVRHGQVHSSKSKFRKKRRADLNSFVVYENVRMRVNLAGSQGGILHLRRERMATGSPKMPRRIGDQCRARHHAISQDQRPCNVGWFALSFASRQYNARVFLRRRKNNVAQPSWLWGRRASCLSDQHCSRDARWRHRQDACATLTPD